MKAIATALVLATVSAKDKKCHALALSGGANNGAWELGVMWGLAHYGDPKHFEWDVVSGISAGSINTIYMSLWAKEDIVAMTETLSSIMATTLTSQIWQMWDLGLIWGLLEKKGLVDDSPMEEYFDWLIKDFTHFKRRFSVGTVDVSTGDFVVFDETNILKNELTQAAISSSSIGAVFPPNYFRERWFMDGGTAWGVNIDSAI
jgi:predicted acylesterase/phospholipase RssA